MIKTIIKSNTYKDSVVLMLLTNHISSFDGVNKVSIMMATPANKDILKQSGMLTDDVDSASADDIAIVMDVESEETVDSVLKGIEEFLNQSNKKSETKNSAPKARTWKQAINVVPDANLAVISIPGIYAYSEADTALDMGLNVFIFSDNVSIEHEVALKRKAHDRGLLVMGPDCGTGILHGVPIAFTNHVAKGNIGIVGASGTGIQEVTSMISNLGYGISSAIGTGGRDLHIEVGGITMLDGLDMLEKDDNTKIIAVISKPPHPEVKKLIIDKINTLSKPVVSLFLGDTPEEYNKKHYQAYTLEETAKVAIKLLNGENIEKFEEDFDTVDEVLTGKTIHGYYSGGTLASEAAMLIEDSLGFGELEKHDGLMLDSQGFKVIDLGDDRFTQGKPHPMIDPSARSEMLKEVLTQDEVGVVMLDVVLGYGSHEDMASALAPAILEIQSNAREKNRDIKILATICGTSLDYQNIDQQQETLENLDVKVFRSNADMVRYALNLIGHDLKSINRKYEDISTENLYLENEKLVENMNLILEQPKIINVGLESFYDNLLSFNIDIVQFDWRPIAGGNLEVIEALKFLNQYTFIEKGGK